MSSVRIESRVSEVISDKNEAVEKVLEKLGMVAEGHAKLELENDPRRIDTGRLRNSIAHAQQDAETEVIGTNVEYAPYVHEGTDRMAPNRFLKNAVQNNVEEYRRIIEQELKG